jgi:hypothetical protein
MSANLISAGTRVDFREAFTSVTLQQIRDIFATGDFEPNLDYQPPVSGQRRTLIEQYFVNIDLTDPRDIKRLLSVFEELLLRLGKGPDWDTIQTQQVTINNLQSRMEIVTSVGTNLLVITHSWQSISLLHSVSSSSPVTVIKNKNNPRRPRHER